MTRPDESRLVKPDFPSREPLPLLDDVGLATGRAHTIVRRLPGGAWGAWLLADESGGEIVLKCVWDVDWRNRLATASRIVDRLRDRGAPIPRFLASGYRPDVGTWYLQERVHGRPLQQVTVRTLPQVIALSGLMTDLGDPPPGEFTWSADVQRTLAHASPQLRLLERAGSAAAAIGDSAAGHYGAAADLSTTDAVHGDLLATQFLVDATASRITAIVDWDEAAHGSRAIDLALLFQNAVVQADRTGIPADDTVLQRLADAGRDGAGDGFAAAVHYHVVKMVAFVIEHNPPHVAWRLDVAQRVLASLAATERVG